MSLLIKERRLLFLCCLVAILILKFVLSVPSFSTFGTTNYTNEDNSPIFSYNFTNITNNSLGETLVFDVLEITSSNSLHSGFTINNFTWIFWNDTNNRVNSSTGILIINSTRDNETGRFNITVFVGNYPDRVGESRLFYFEVNATNDAPSFTNITNAYNLSQALNFLNFLNGSDEESHYPLNFSISFVSNCTHSSWSGRTDGQNCSLSDLGFGLTGTPNLSALMNFTPTSNDVGTYWANISVRDFGESDSYGCPHAYCQNSTYKVNKTTNYSTSVTFNIYSALDINASDCQNKIFNESQYGTCNVTIRTKSEAASIDISTAATLRNYPSGQSGVSNLSWFQPNITTTSSNFQKNITINVTPGKTEIGNWTINFTASDTTNSENGTAQIYVYVNRTSNDVPDLLSLSNLNTSINLMTVINLTVHDDDFLIPDKNLSSGGFNETLNLTRFILNRSNLAQHLTLSNFSITFLQMPVSGTNRTTAEIRFNANSSDIGNYTINATARDNESSLDYVTFNLTIINNTYPQWVYPLNTTIVGLEGNNIYFNLSQNVSDAEGDTLTFSYTNDTLFPSLNITTAGLVNFTPVDGDIGTHIVNITASDGYLTNTTSFNFTIYNINDNPLVKNMDLTNATNTSNGATIGLANASSINSTEDSYITISLWMEDDDLRIPAGQKGYYNESFTLNLTITGVNSSLFNFTRNSGWWPMPDSAPSQALQNTTKYDAIFTPRKASVGNYTITANLTDLNNVSYVFIFYMNITGVEHSPNLSLLSNQTSAVNRSFYYDINVTDTENGNDTSGVNTNFTFSYQFLDDGSIVSFLNSTNFNSTTGVINMTFNSTQDGRYHINVTVNDSTNRTNTRDFWVFVYGVPNVSSPSSGAVLNLTENITSILNFTVNHSVLDNLTYLFYTDFVTCPYQSTSNCNYSSSVLRNSTNYYGNGTSYNLSFATNFTDETYGLLKNLTLVVYPNSSSLENASLLNTTTIFKLNVSYTNYPITWIASIPDQGPVTHDNDITLDLSTYFRDYDHSDSYYNQSTTWSKSSNGSAISASVSSSWTLTLSSSTAVAELMNISGNDSVYAATSDSFLVRFTEPTSSTTSSSTGGGGTTLVPVSLKILMPDPVSAYQQDRIELPITLFNNGEQSLNGITLNATIAKNGSLANDVKISLSQNYFSSLAPGEKKNITLIAEVNTTQVGLFEITINADVDSPSYNDWGKLFLTIKEGVDIEEKILFTEEFIVSNPECVELRELVNEAKELYAKGETETALKKSEEAIDACKNAISQAGKPRIKKIVENKLYRYLAISTAGAFVLGVAYYSYRRIRLRRKQGSFLQQDIKNRNLYNKYSGYGSKGGVWRT